MTTVKQDEWDDASPSYGARFPVYKQMGSLDVSSGGDGPLVAMARLIQDDAESGGCYIVRMGPMTIMMDVELHELPS